MKKLKITLQHNICFLILLFFVFLSLIIVYFYKRESKYKNNENIIKGYILEKYIYDDKLVLLVKGKEKIIVYYYENTFDCSVNDYILIKGKIKEVENNRVFNNFNYKEYLYRENIFWEFNANNISLIKQNNNLLYKLKDLIINRINNTMSKEYLNAFILGNKKYLSTDQKNILQNLGLIHLFSVSGMHISFFLIFLNKLFKKNKIIILLLLFLYSFIVGFQVSVLRCLISYLIRLINNKYSFNISKINELYICAIILLIINPYNVVKVGFQLSFIILFFILYFKDILTNSIRFSIITFIASFPIIINNYYEVNFLSIILNIIYIPFISIIIFPLSFIVCLFPLFDNLYYNLITIFEITINFFNKTNFLNISFSKIPIILIFLYYFILLLKRKKLLFIFIVFLYFYNYYLFYPTIYYIDVKQGDSSLIRIHNKNILIDTGGIPDNNKVITNSISFFKSVGVKKIDYLILTHGDYDHMGEAINLVENFKVEKVIFNCGPYNDLEKELIKVLDKKKIKYYSCIKELNLDNNRLYFLQTKEYDNENDNSNVIYTELAGYKFMFMGDAEVDKEKDILDKYTISNIDVLKVGHHGSKTSSSKDFIDEINPKYSIISVGKNNRYGHPNKEVLNNLNKSKIYRTDQDESIMFKIKNNKLKIETCSP